VFSGDGELYFHFMSFLEMITVAKLRFKNKNLKNFRLKGIIYQPAALTVVKKRMIAIKISAIVSNTVFIVWSHALL